MQQLLAQLGIAGISGGTAIGPNWSDAAGPALVSRSPIDGSILATLRCSTATGVDKAIAAANEAFHAWQSVPAPRRGEFVRRIGDKIRGRKQQLAELITCEVGKIPQEALGEVQEWIDMCDYAVGLSRQLYGLTIVSERPDHRMMEQWHPLGAVGVITAFNFPMAVWAWNAMVGLVCGDTIIWKPSEKAPLCAIACHQAACEVAKEMPEVPPAVISLVLGERAIGEQLAASSRVPLISATGSGRMGQAVAATVGKRLGRTLLELGGNNAMIVGERANLELAVRAIVFSAVGTCGQRCTSLRRLIVSNKIKSDLVSRLSSIYQTLPIGDPRVSGNLVGPLIDEASGQAMAAAIQSAKAQGGKVVCGGERVTGSVPTGVYVRPAVIEIGAEAAIVREETFAPILYVMGYDTFEQAIAMHNDVPQGLSSSIFTDDMREAERFLSPAGSDCGIANVNIGTSGAEIGGAFGGEKQTGGGRESGSDSWKAYMRRVTNTINYGTTLPLAQGIKF
jgi:aldehyde dehydrogenase (NAD+)